MNGYTSLHRRVRVSSRLASLTAYRCMHLIYYHFIIRRLDPLDSFPQQFLCILVHADQLLGDVVLRPVLLLRQALDPPDLGQELADFLNDVSAILLGHGLCGSILLMGPFQFYPFRFRLSSCN